MPTSLSRLYDVIIHVDMHQFDRRGKADATRWSERETGSAVPWILFPIRRIVYIQGERYTRIETSFFAYLLRR
jgi:hypothetical protein